MEDMQNKDISIRIIWNAILNEFGVNFFTLVDFWDSDNFAFGFKIRNKLIFVSTWDFRDNKTSEIKCYSEFELINEESFETEFNSKQLKEISIDELINQIRIFVLMN